MKKIASMLLVAASFTACGGSGGGGGEPAPAAQAAPVVVPEKFALWGDSLTAGGFGTELKTLLPTRTIYEGGVGAQTSTEIAARQGSVQPLMSVTGGVIPASGAVLISSRSVDPINNQGGGPLVGTLAGVRGELTRANDNSYTFTRLTSGANTAVNPGSPFAADPQGRDSWASVFWMGRNNSYDPTTVKADIAGAIAFLKATPKKYVVLSILNGDGESIGSGSHTTITQLNNELGALYPANYIDIRAHLISKYDPAQPQDVIDHNNDVVPSSLRSDAIHLNTAGNVVVAQRVAAFIAAKGW